MVISSIQIERFKNSDTKLKGAASITLDGIIAIHNIKILENNDKMFLGMPSKKLSDGSFSDFAHPINTKFREMLEKLVFAAYKEAKEYKCLRLNATLRTKYSKIDFDQLSYDYYLSNNPFLYEIAI